MNETDSFRVKIKESAFENNRPIRRLLASPDGSPDTVREYPSREAADLDAKRFTELGTKKLRLQPADHDPSEFQSYIVSSGTETGGYGRTTRNASSGWGRSRKETIERDNFTCQDCGSVGGPDGNVELHVDHITPQSEGGSDDPDNLQTLCRDCHMTKHGSSGPDTSATAGEIAQSITLLTQTAEVPAFEKSRLYELVDDSLEDAMGGRDLNDVLDTLMRYDSLEQLTLQDEFENRLTGETKTREKSVFYSVTGGFDPCRLSYDDELLYGGEPVVHGDPSYLMWRQTNIDEFQG